MKLTITNNGGTYNITELVPSVTWAGNYQQAARSLDFSLVSSAADASVPEVECPLGAAVQMEENGEILFDGFIVSRSKNTETSSIEVSCYDRGFYLRQNKDMYKFTNTTPEAIVKRLAADYGFAVGHAEATGVNISRNFLSGNDSLYDIIITAYTLASKTTKKQYHVGFRGTQLYVTVKAPDERTLILQGGSNLIAANTKEDIESMVNQVQIYSEEDVLVRTVQDAPMIELYGQLRQIIKQTKDDDKAAEAQTLLEENRVHQEITVDCLGNIANMTGGTVVMQEPYTGLYGLFYIDSDTHEWKRGQYYNNLTLNFKSIMDEKEAGSLPNKDGKNTSGS